MIKNLVILGLVVVVTIYTIVKVRRSFKDQDD